MCCARVSSRRLSCSARQAWVRQDSWSSTSCCACFASNCTGFCSWSEPSLRTQSDWQGLVQRPRWCSQPWQLRARAQGFHAAGKWLDTRSEPLHNAFSDRTDRASSSSFPESSAARFCDFSSDFMALATHMSLSLASHSTKACNSVPMESLLLINSSSMRNSPAP